jgi:hypothetical protein
MEVLKTNLCRRPGALGVAFQAMESDSQVAEIVYTCRSPTRKPPGRPKDQFKSQIPLYQHIFCAPAPQKALVQWDLRFEVIIPGF